MNIEKIEKNLQVESLENYILELIQNSKIEADAKVDNLINGFITYIDENKENKELLSIGIISNLVHIRKIIYNYENKNFNFYVNNFKNKMFNITNLQNNQFEDTELAKFIIKIINSFEFNWIITLSKFKELKTEIPSYYFSEILLNKLPYLFKLLNELNLIKDFTWDISNLENGITELYKDLYLKYQSQINSLELKIKFENEKYESKFSSLNDKFDYEVRSLKRDIESKEYTIELYKEYTKKYMENQSVVIFETYFGDNVPFLINVYNFLVKNQFIKGLSWSYFYSCLVIGNNEIINLTNNGKLNFIGRFFYFLKNYIDIKYRSNNEYKDFIYQKFYINEAAMSEAFYRNYVVDYYDNTKHKNLAEIDVFFSNLDEIFLKS